MRPPRLDGQPYAARMTLETKIKIIREWDSRKDRNLGILARRLGLQRNQVSRVLCTRLNYVENLGRAIVVNRRKS